MSCGCNQPCNCQPRPSVCCTPTTESVEYTFENANLAGIGVFDNETDYLVQFRGIVSTNPALTVTLDAVNNTIVIDFDDSALVTAIPDATTTQRGILETATNAEALAKAANDKIVTPSNFAAMGSSDTFAGLVELATTAETQAGASTTLAVTPAGLAATLALSNMTTFADAVARAAATPSFDGQLGVQLDNNTVWSGSGTGAGDFNVPVFTGNNTTTLGSNTTFDIGTNQLNFTNGFVNSDAYHVFYNNRVDFGLLGQPQIIDFYETQLYITNTIIPADSVLITSNTAGTPSSALISTFLSTANVQTGYTTFTNPATLRTCDTSTVTLPQLAQIVGTLIEDLKAALLPAT